jgi:hypothetical protein
MLQAARDYLAVMPKWHLQRRCECTTKLMKAVRMPGWSGWKVVMPLGVPRLLRHIDVLDLEGGRPFGLESCLNDCRSFWELGKALGIVGEEGLAFVYRYGVHFKDISFGFVTEMNNERECSTLQG